ncbi:DNA N-6-adenine-methyltransferase [Lachnospiraceae bacterium 46-15]
MNTGIMFSSAKDDWETPQEFFDELDKEFGFNLDPCADESNHKCQVYFTKEEDGLSRDWGGCVVFCNPPYGRNVTGKWVKKAHDTLEAAGKYKHKTAVVMLIPARTDTKWFHEYIYNKSGVEVRFLKGRLKFVGAEHSAPFPSMVVVFR